MNVYLVTMGDCECGHNLGLFSTREKAQAFVDAIARVDGMNHAKIEEHTLDSVKFPERSSWWVLISQDGEILRVEKRPFYEYHHDIQENREDASVGHAYGNIARVTMYAKSATEAITIALEQFELSTRLGFWDKQSWYIKNGKLIDEKEK